jgi:ATP-dependent protease ClpP protease subunit
LRLSNPGEINIDDEGFYTVETIKVTSRMDIYIYGSIPDFDDPKASQLINTIETTDAPNIIVTISSFGGDLYTSLAIYNALRSRLPETNIVTIGNGVVASGAAVIFMAGEQRLAYGNTTFMVHGPQYDGYMSGSIKNFEMDAQFTSKMYRNLISETFGGRFTEEEISDICDKNVNKYFDTKEALEKNIVTEIIFGKPDAEDFEDGKE